MVSGLSNVMIVLLLFAITSLFVCHASNRLCLCLTCLLARCTRLAVEVCGGWQDPNAEHHVKGKFHHTNSIRAKPFQDDKAKDGRPEPRHGAFEVQVAFMTPEGAKGPNGQDCGDRYTTSAL
jgi:hypothetical protein